MTDKTGSSPATLHDVAELAGVSYQTVSRVINHSPNVTPKTLEKVNRAIAELNYRPNRVARSLVTGKGKSSVIHVLAFDLHNLRMLPGIQHGAQRHGFQLQLTSLLHDEDALRALKSCINDIVAGQVDGVIFILPWRLMSETELRQLMREIPFVVVGSSLGFGTNSILVDQYEGTRLVVQHLLDLGHTRIAAIHGIEFYYDAHAREETLVKALRQKNLALVASERGIFDIASGYQAAARLLAGGPSFSALVCANDEMALGAMRAIKDRGLRVPEDISVVGFDDQSFAPYCDPPLTTVRQDFHAIGAHSLDHLVSLIKLPETAPHQRLLYPELVVRKSTSVPSSLSARKR